MPKLDLKAAEYVADRMPMIGVGTYQVFDKSIVIEMSHMIQSRFNHNQFSLIQLMRHSDLVTDSSILPKSTVMKQYSVEFYQVRYSIQYIVIYR